ncbi:hypothetical protein CLV63_11875 [Murinocardiopsis flavida]|uniref:Uncharacterized protein n=1 Tax=Murinocardiopsis flavida TaxID=645275 RepID=A0A2P8D520_9ACTN|nr:hypothetical protein [Murinocardiopsis flavida]PSK92316.1 hypothetical protein CLV63_11875 [Murinocardiopsis flavida]
MILRIPPTLVLVLTALLLTASARPAVRGSPEEVDGFVLTHLPHGIGTGVADFRTEWGGVAFASRVWERRLPDGGHRVDAKVNVMRGERLRDLASLRAFLAEYHEHDPDDWHLVAFEHPEGHGLRTSGFVFWLVRPGTAVSIRLDPERFGAAELTRTALGTKSAG